MSLVHKNVFNRLAQFINEYPRQEGGRFGPNPNPEEEESNTYSEDHWTNTDYLKTGTPTQRSAYKAIESSEVMKSFKDLNPILTGTVPIKINTSTSDLDIVFNTKDLSAFEAQVKAKYGSAVGFESHRITQEGREASVTNFTLHGWPFQLFAQDRPTKENTSFRHMLVEDRLLRLGGPDVSKQIIALKKSGVKTEPAFAQVFQVKGDNPYSALLKLDKLSDEELAKHITVPNKNALVAAADALPRLRPDKKKTKTAGLAVLAEDTGRVLMLQRSDPGTNKHGKWEFPGGHLNPDEAYHEAAIREWEEETGMKFPSTGKWNTTHWLSPDKKYVGLIYRIPKESDLDINPPKSRRVPDPDNPKSDPNYSHEVVAWWSPKDLQGNPALREEAHTTPWHILASSNSFTKLLTASASEIIYTLFANDCHDEQGKFCEGEGEGETATSSSEVNYSALAPQKFAKDLRDKTLQSLDNPALAVVIHEWQHGSDNLVRHDPTLIGAIQNSPATPQVLYRGVVDTSGGIKAIMNKYKDNSEITLPASSFSSSYGVAKVFTLGGETEPGKGTSVVFGVLKGAKALPIQNLAETSSFHSEKEFITGGRFKVIGADKNPDVPGGILVTLKQLDTETLK